MFRETHGRLGYALMLASTAWSVVSRLDFRKLGMNWAGAVKVQQLIFGSSLEKEGWVRERVGKLGYSVEEIEQGLREFLFEGGRKILFSDGEGGAGTVNWERL